MYEIEVNLAISFTRVLIQFLFPYFIQINVIVSMLNILTKSTQRAQTSLAEADHYSYIAHCKNVEPWL